MNIIIYAILLEFYGVFTPQISLPEIKINFVETLNIPVVDPDSHQTRLAHAACFARETIMINKTWWDSAPLMQQKKVLFHELGHCVLGLEHTLEPLEFSIMNQSLNVVKLDGSNWILLIEELKKRYKDSCTKNMRFVCSNIKV